MSPDVVARGTIPLANKARKGLLGGLGGSSGAVQDLRDGPTLSGLSEAIHYQKPCMCLSGAL